MNRLATVALALLVVLRGDAGFVDAATANGTSDPVTVTIDAQNYS
jgi:hypothetical protein